MGQTMTSIPAHTRARSPCFGCSSAITNLDLLIYSSSFSPPRGKLLLEMPKAAPVESLKSGSGTSTNTKKDVGTNGLDQASMRGMAFGLLKCLMECPADARKDLIASIVVCGEIPMVVPDLGRRLAWKVKDLLGTTTSSFSLPAAESTTHAPSRLQRQENLIPRQEATFVPLITQGMKTLEGFVGVLSCSPYRPDLVSWACGSLYSSIWLVQGEFQ